MKRVMSHESQANDVSGCKRDQTSMSLYPCSSLISPPSLCPKEPFSIPFDTERCASFSPAQYHHWIALSSAFVWGPQMLLIGSAAVAVTFCTVLYCLIHYGYSERSEEGKRERKRRGNIAIIRVHISCHESRKFLRLELDYLHSNELMNRRSIITMLTSKWTV